MPVYDTGETVEIPCYFVSKYTKGSSLKGHIKSDRSRRLETHVIVTTLANALQFAHENRVVHREIKPGNIMIDGAGQSLIVNFGLVVIDNDVDRRERYAGTPAYLSPEQARGEGNSIDGRTDIFSLGPKRGGSPFWSLAWQGRCDEGRGASSHVLTTIGTGGLASSSRCVR